MGERGGELRGVYCSRASGRALLGLLGCGVTLHGECRELLWGELEWFEFEFVREREFEEWEELFEFEG